MKKVIVLLISLLGCANIYAQDTIYIQNEYVIFFEKDSYTLENGCLEKLNEIPENSRVCVTGFASPEGNAEQNIMLSQRRADEVTAYLRKRKITVDSSVGLGVQGSASNRVVIVNILL